MSCSHPRMIDDPRSRPVSSKDAACNLSSSCLSVSGLWKQHQNRAEAKCIRHCGKRLMERALQIFYLCCPTTRVGINFPIIPLRVRRISHYTTNVQTLLLSLGPSNKHEDGRPAAPEDDTLRPKTTQAATNNDTSCDQRHKLRPTTTQAALNDKTPAICLARLFFPPTRHKLRQPTSTTLSADFHDPVRRKSRNNLTLKAPAIGSLYSSFPRLVRQQSVKVDPEVSETVRAFYDLIIEGDCWHCLSYFFVVGGSPQDLRLAWTDFEL